MRVHTIKLGFLGILASLVIAPAVAQETAPIRLNEFQTASDLIMSIQASPNGPHEDGVWPAVVANCLKMNEDGTSCSQYELGLWDMSTGEPLGQQVRGQNDFLAVKFHPSGHKIATASALRGILQLWDISADNTLEAQGDPLVLGKFVLDFAFNPDGTVLAAVGKESLMEDSPVIGMWDVETHQRIDFPVGVSLHDATTVAYSPDGRYLAVGHCAEFMNMLAPLLEAYNLDPETDPADVDEDTKAAAEEGSHQCSRGEIDLLDSTTGALAGKPLVGHEGTVDMLAFSPDGKYLASASLGDRVILLWDTTTQMQIGQPLVGHTNAVFGLKFSADGRFLFSSSTDTTARVWNVASALTEEHPGAYTLQEAGSGVTSLDVFPGTNALLLGNWQGSVSVWSIAETLSAPFPQAPNPALVHRDAITDLIVTTDGRILTNSLDASIGIWNVQDEYVAGARYYPTTRFFPPVEFALHPDGRTLALGRDTGKIALWNLETHALVGGPFLFVEDDKTSIRAIEFSPDGRWLAAGYQSGKIYLWDFSQGVPQSYTRVLEGHTDSASTLAFSPDSQTLASGSVDSTVRLWDIGAIAEAVNQGGLAADVATEKEVWTDHLAPVMMITFSPDGQHLASSSYDNTILIWDVATGQSVYWTAPEGVFGIAYSPDGQLLASASDNGEVRIWKTDAPIGLGDWRVIGTHTSPGGVVIFTLDGKMVISTDYDGNLGRWPVE